MKVAIEVKDRAEAGLLKAGLEDPATRAAVMIVGALASLPTSRAKLRVLNHVKDRLDEEAEAKTA